MVKHKKLNVVKLFLILFFVITVIAPLISMLFHISQIDIMAFVASQQFKTGLLNSLLLATCATVISIFLAMLLSFATERSNIKFKNMWCIIFTLPMLIPSISNGMGLILLLGSNGVLTNLFNLDFNVYGFQGVLIGSVMYSFPVAFLMFQDMLRYEDYTPYEAAKVLGIPRKNQILSIFLPYMKKPLISVFFSVFTMVITDYGVPLMVGGKFNTLPVLMYNEVIGLLNFGKGGAIGVVLLVPAVIAFLIDIFNKDNSIQDFITKKARIAKNKLRDILSYILCTVTSIVVVLPIAMFCFLSFIKKYPTDISFSLSNIFKAFNMNAGQFLLNALIIAASVSIIGTAFSYITAYITARVPGKRSKTLHLFSITSMAIPGLVLGLSFAIFFKG
ncbi:MAG: ABC transporter permease subunit, partial [Oscillospiraceae bacterium]